MADQEWGYPVELRSLVDEKCTNSLCLKSHLIYYTLFKHVCTYDRINENKKYFLNLDIYLCNNIYGI